MTTPYWSDGIDRPEGESETRRALRFTLACISDNKLADERLLNDWLRGEIAAAERGEARYLKVKAVGA